MAAGNVRNSLAPEVCSISPGSEPLQSLPGGMVSMNWKNAFSEIERKASSITAKDSLPAITIGARPKKK